MTEPFPGDSPGSKASKSVDPLKYATDYHAPVLCNTVVEVLITDPEGTYIDCTLGGGGHTHALLDTLAPQALVVGIDRDPEAIKTASTRLASEIDAGRLRIVQANFSEIEQVASDEGLKQIDGVLLDFGVSSHQLDQPGRGFSHRETGKLDMRMGVDTELTADTIVNTWSQSDLTRVLRRYGEEPMAYRIAKDIIRNRPVADTSALAHIIRSLIKGPRAGKALARVFQALRVQVNDELAAIENALPAATVLVKDEGRCVAMSYHSLEDRMAKRYFRAGNFDGVLEKDFYGNVIAPWRPITNRPVTANDEEIKANPRARSVRLRAAVRTRSHESSTTHIMP